MPIPIDKLPDLELLMTMAQTGIQPRDLAASKEQRPYTSAGAYSVGPHVYDMDQMADGVGGVTFRTKNGRNSSIVLNGRQKDPYTLAHEYEHALANQGLGSSSELNSKFDSLSGGSRKDREQLVRSLIQAAPHLVEKWGLSPEDASSGYFSDKMAKHQGSLTPNLLYEQMATLSALEQSKNKRLVDDPYIRENVFKTPAQRETYDALTGLRQTRLDARDLPPYTRQPESRGQTNQANTKQDWIDMLMKMFRK